MVFSKQGGEYLSFDDYNNYKSKLKDSHTLIYDEDDYQAFFQNALPKDTEKHGEILKNCYILKKYLLNFKSDESCNYGKCCSYMNYWLNEKIGKNKNSLVKSDFDVYNNYIAYYNRRNNANVCESNEIFIGNDIYKEMKRLYTLYDLYNTFKTISDQNNSRCRQLKSCVAHYHSILRNCKQDSSTKFCKALQNFKKKTFSPDEFVSLSKCKKNFGELNLKDPQDLPELSLQQVDLDLLQSNRETSRRESLESSLHSQQVESTEGDSYSILSSFSHSTVIQTLFSSALGMSILFFLSYKFTPFGKWMRSALLRKNIITHYETEEDTQDILSHTYENTNTDTEDSIHNIQYYATQNS
ncbi:PIR Superfamily Protein [Plasmodium ovale wallikeri]|uniref:PIR Superfamily Protein n=1 Tax=Plasmodium ovale wallikeri TaxID=864142 RepID=A0A1A9AR34_PLAOA|nr:PIR Superfamily Protein [Plasmodium ovale wallikeri]